MKVRKEMLLQGERAEKTQNYWGWMPAHFLVVRRASNGAVWVVYSSFPCKAHIRWGHLEEVFRMGPSAETLNANSAYRQISSVSMGCDPTLLLLVYVIYYVPEI